MSGTTPSQQNKTIRASQRAHLSGLHLLDHPPWMSGGYRHAGSVTEQVAG
jgi:hypothetical protein